MKLCEKTNGMWFWVRVNVIVTDENNIAREKEHKNDGKMMVWLDAI